jgi:DNA-binding MarR family transcriptional regulator
MSRPTNPAAPAGPADPAGSGDPRGAAFASVFVVAQHLDRLGDVVLAPLGLTTKQWLLLAVVERAFAGRQPTLTEAAAVYGSSRQNVKAMARGLEAAGYLRLVPDGTDRRALRLVSTGRSEVFSGAPWKAREAAFFAFAFGGLGAAEVEQLAALLGRWLAAVSARPDTPSPAPARSTGA